MKINWVVVVMICLVIIAVFAGCGAPPGSDDPDSQKYGNFGVIRVINVKLPDGRTVTCVTNKNGYSGGISCDWDHVR